jgi:serine/threonine protein kinase/Tfp pilus assembly protein PilF
MTIPAGTKLGRYQIRSKIGEGGMGEVYLALDTELGRTVAIKILPEALASNQRRLQRFIQEARAASALNHPHILTIYEIGTTGATHFIATEFIDGETLRQHISKGMKLAEILEIAIQAGSALAAAHEASIIHRDIKPENIMVRRDGYIKLLDFGLAKLTEPSIVDSEAPTRAIVDTHEGTVMGTANYMSPEQAQGTKVDARTDLWSLGAVLYEMVTEQVPFAGQTPTETISLILQKEPAPLTRYTHEVPAELDRIVTKALTKDREARYQTAKDLLIDLRNLKRKLEVDAEIDRTVPPEFRTAGSTSGGPGTAATASGAAAATAQPRAAPGASSAEYILSGIKQHKLAAAIALLVLVIGAVGLSFYLHARNTEVAIESIAVLPFVNQNNDPNTDYLSDGVTESIINSLTQLPNLKVIARSSVFRYKGKATDPLMVGKELGVRAIVTGRIMQRGDNLTISTELVDVRDNKQLWGEQYNRTVSDLLAVQRDIAGEVSSNLRLRLSGADANRLSKQYTENAEAYRLYLKGRFFLNKRTEEDVRKAIDYFQQVIAMDPNNALALTGLADAYSHLVFPLGSVAPRDAMPMAREAATHALAIDMAQGEAHASLAYEVFFYEWNWPESEREFKRAIELNPNSADAHHWYSHYLMAHHRIDESLAESKRALELSPIDLIVNIHLGWHYLYARQYDQALEQLNRVVEMDRNFAQTYTWLGLVYEQQKKYPEAIAAFQKAIVLFPGGSTQAKGQLGHAFAVSGKKNEALKMIAELADTARHTYVSPYQVAAIYAGLGDKDQAFAWLEKAYADRSEWLVNLSNDQRFDDLRSDLRFANLARRVGLPQ